jgi:hypothetical protein
MTDITQLVSGWTLRVIAHLTFAVELRILFIQSANVPQQFQLGFNRDSAQHADTFGDDSVMGREAYFEFQLTIRAKPGPSTCLPANALPTTNKVRSRSIACHCHGWFGFHFGKSNLQSFRVPIERPYYPQLYQVMTGLVVNQVDLN